MLGTYFEGAFLARVDRRVALVGCSAAAGTGSSATGTSIGGACSNMMSGSGSTMLGSSTSILLGDVGTSAGVTRGRSRSRWFLHTLERTQSVEAALVVGVSELPCSLLALNHRNEQLSIN